MSEWDSGDNGDHGYDGGTDYGHVEAGADHESLDQLHQVHAADNNYDSNFGVYEQDSASAESTSFDQGHHVSFTDPSGAQYEESDFTSYDHNEANADHVFAAEGSEHSSASEYDQLDALQARLDSTFASGTELHTDGGSAALGVASN
ncbi:hypothetical protein AB0J72_46190 [Dactylosporangium sp. NPDC049742]|uniref:hypothetical protein n=1 Tax=Dactylosporangium sp. NPDC049742 TaxID=3154737 RepID=UPI003446661A